MATLVTPATPSMSVPRNVIYYSSKTNAISLAGIAALPYTDVIIGFLIPDSNMNLKGAGGAFDSNLQSNIQTLQKAGKNVLISVGGGAGFPSAAWQFYAGNVNNFTSQIVAFVTQYGFNGVDIDYEDDNGFTDIYDGVGLLSALTSALAQALPSGQTIVTHAPQTPYWDSTAEWQGAYIKIWQQVGNQIAWINNQFYNNSSYDSTASDKVTWYEKIAAITGPQKLMVGELLPGKSGGNDPGAVLPTDVFVSQVIAPLQAKFGLQFGGVMGWEFAVDQSGAWANEIATALSNYLPSRSTG